MAAVLQLCSAYAALHGHHRLFRYESFHVTIDACPGRNRHCTRGGLQPPGRDTLPTIPGVSRAGHHGLVCNGSDVARGCGVCSSRARAYASLLLLLIRLQRRCVSRTLSHANGSPPRDTGMISSTSALNGCGVRRLLSTGFPQIAHVSYAASTRARSCRRLCPFALRGLVRFIATTPPIRRRPRTIHTVQGRTFALSYTRRAILHTLAVTLLPVNRTPQQEHIGERVHGPALVVLAHGCDAFAFAPLGDGVAFDVDAAGAQKVA